MNNDKFKFLSAPRFWAMVLMVCAAIANGDVEVFEGIQYLTGGFLGIGTVDRITDKLQKPKIFTHPSFGVKEDFQKWKIQKNGIELIKSFEGLHLDAYLDPVGIPTIGYGHIRTAKLGQVITNEQADDLLRQDVAFAEKAVNTYVNTEITQNQYDALVSFTFNLGAGNLKMSHLLKFTNERKFELAANEFGRWVYAGGRKLNGLVRRREEEKNLYLKGIFDDNITEFADWEMPAVNQALAKGIKTDLTLEVGKMRLSHLLAIIKKFIS